MSSRIKLLHLSILFIHKSNIHCLAPHSHDEVGASAAQDVPIALASGGAGAFTGSLS
jgi:hypothetical protein